MKKKQKPYALFSRKVGTLIGLFIGIFTCSFSPMLFQKISNWWVYSHLIGEELVVTDAGKLYILKFGWQRSAYTLTPLASGLDGNARFPEWSPDGEWIAFDYVEGGEDERSIYIVRADGTNLQRLVSGVSPQWDSSGRIIYYTDGSDDETIKAINLDTGDIQDIFHSRDCDRSGVIGNYHVNPVNNHAVLQIDTASYEWLPENQSCRSLGVGWDAAWSIQGKVSLGVYGYRIVGQYEHYQQPRPSELLAWNFGHDFSLGKDENTYLVVGGSPAWSPDGRYFVYDSPRNMMYLGGWSLYVYDTQMDDVYDLGMNFSHPSWRP